MGKERQIRKKQRLRQRKNKRERDREMKNSHKDGEEFELIETNVTTYLYNDTNVSSWGNLNCYESFQAMPRRLG